MNARVRSCLTPLLTVLLSTASTLIGVAPLEAQNVGRVGAVNQDATSTPPGNASRMLAIGTNVVHKERIQTTASGSTQILFPDTSTLSVGRNSNIVIDEYVYDPNAGTGKMVASVGKGVLRFVGGQISHTSGVTIKTPVATLGIRGGVATIVYPITANYAAADPNVANCKGELIVGHVGSSTIRNSTGSTTVRPGFATCVTGPNDPIPEPFRVSDGLLAQIMTNLTSRPGQQGGAIDLPTDQMASRQGLGASTLPDPTHPPGTDPLGYVSIFDGGNDLAKNKAQTNQTQQAPPPDPGCGSYCC
ncbi:MAG: FecR domain-containing protein [Afipia felis]|nr:FecR domain-containing protein [Afipia felis]